MSDHLHLYLFQILDLILVYFTLLKWVPDVITFVAGLIEHSDERVSLVFLTKNYGYTLGNRHNLIKGTSSKAGKDLIAALFII